MSAGEAIAIGFAAGSACTLVITLVMLIKASRNRISVAATVLGIGRREAIQLDKEGRLYWLARHNPSHAHQGQQEPNLRGRHGFGYRSAGGDSAGQRRAAIGRVGSDSACRDEPPGAGSPPGMPESGNWLAPARPVTMEHCGPCALTRRALFAGDDDGVLQDRK